MVQTAKVAASYDSVARLSIYLLCLPLLVVYGQRLW